MGLADRVCCGDHHGVVVTTVLTIVGQPGLSPLPDRPRLHRCPCLSGHARSDGATSKGVNCDDVPWGHQAGKRSGSLPSLVWETTQARENLLEGELCSGAGICQTPASSPAGSAAELVQGADGSG